LLSNRGGERYGPAMERVPLVRLLSMATSLSLEELHRELARAGYDTLRPAHGYALNAILNGRRTASEIAPRLGMTKQGASRLLQHLLEEGYVEQTDAGDDDARRKPFTLTTRGRRAIELSVRIQQRIEEQWGDEIGVRRGNSMREALERVVQARTQPDGELPAVRPAW
jgi:DNA-binding MarR family transcriptional regulator